MKTKKFNDEVYFSSDSIPKIRASDIEELKQKAKHNQRKRIRLCVHKKLSDDIHEMLIVHEKNCYVQPHKHANKIESFHIIEGIVDIILFTEDGNINDIISMGDYSTGRMFFYRLSASVYHTLLIKSDVLVFHETTNGPFRPEDTIWAPWSPNEFDEKKVSAYLEVLTISTENIKDQCPNKHGT